MDKYLLFSCVEYYPGGGMYDCIFSTDSIDKLNEYIIERFKDSCYQDEYVQYYDIENKKLYSADTELLKQGIAKWYLVDWSLEQN